MTSSLSPGLPDTASGAESAVGRRVEGGPSGKRDDSEGAEGVIGVGAEAGTKSGATVSPRTKEFRGKMTEMDAEHQVAGTGLGQLGKLHVIILADRSSQEYVRFV